MCCKIGCALSGAVGTLLAELWTRTIDFSLFPCKSALRPSVLPAVGNDNDVYPFLPKL